MHILLSADPALRAGYTITLTMFGLVLNSCSKYIYKHLYVCACYRLNPMRCLINQEQINMPESARTKNY